MWTLVVLVTGAFAHNPSRDGALEPFFVDGDLSGVWTTAGLVRQDDLAWLEVCGASMPGLTDATLAGDGRFLRTGEGLLEESGDGGCSWTVRADVPLAVGLTWLGDTLIATSSNPAAEVYVSADGGVTFQPAAPFPRVATPTGIAADGAGAWWATATGPPDAVFTSADAGASWQEVPVPPTTGVVFLEPQGPGPHGGVIVSAPTLVASTTVWESSADGWDLLLTLPLSANAVACVGPVCLATLSDIALVRWDADLGTASVEVVPNGPIGCLVTDDAGVVWGCNARGAIALFAKTSDGFTFEQSLAGEVIAKRVCPDGTAGKESCPLPPAPPLDTGFPADTDGSAGTDDGLVVEGGCCATGGPPPRGIALPSAFALALVLVGKLRRTPRSLAH